MKELILNAGSSSLKYMLFEMPEEKVIAKGSIDCIGANEDGTFKLKSEPLNVDVKKKNKFVDHEQALNVIIDGLKSNKIINDMKEIDAIGHRILHGGDKFTAPILIDEDVKKAIDECAVFGPLHNPAQLLVINNCEKVLPGVPMVAIFDTAFHQTMPDYSYMYALPYEYYEKYGIRRYGFHGTSHRYVSIQAAKMLGKNPEEVNLVTCHLGNGSSISAIKNGKCYDTTMGMSPLEGIIMGTRSGSFDPAVIPFLMEKEGLTPKDIDTMMNKKSGILGVTGGETSDNRTIEEGAKSGNKRYQLVENMLVHQLTKYIGGYMAALGGVDAIVFCGGIGENNPQYRTRVAEKLNFVGLQIDEELNAKATHTDDAYDITTEDSKIKMLVIPTNEELMIARDTYDIVNK